MRNTIALIIMTVIFLALLYGASEYGEQRYVNWHIEQGSTTNQP